jgi:hypothetical protein
MAVFLEFLTFDPAALRAFLTDCDDVLQQELLAEAEVVHPGQDEESRDLRFL